ncbi:MAG: hypothetical protein ACTHJH_08410 [Marmoricola sp.]
MRITSLTGARRRGQGAVALVAALSAATAGVALTTSSADASAPSMTFTADSHGVVHYRGPSSLHAGVVRASYAQPAAGPGVEIWRLKSGYTFTMLKRDSGNFGQSQPTQAGMKRLFSHAQGYGGLGTDGHAARGRFALTRAGHYVALAIGEHGAKLVKSLTVTGQAPHASAPSAGTVTMRDGMRFGGSKVLPAKGSIKVWNRATDSPHFLVLQHVADGTTRSQVMQALQSPNPPSFMRAGSRSTGTLSPGHWQTLGYSLPAGTYVEMCFFPGPDGMPHAMMGMVRMVTLK